MVLKTQPQRPVIDEIDVLNDSNEGTGERPLETTPLAAEIA